MYNGIDEFEANLERVGQLSEKASPSVGPGGKLASIPQTRGFGAKTQKRGTK